MKKMMGILLIVVLLIPVALTGQEAETAKEMKPALIIIDIQNQYLGFIPERDKEMGLQYINWAIGLFRLNGFPVYRVYHTDPQYGPDPGSEAFQFTETIQIQESDPKIVKNYPNAFKKTDLEKLLSDEGCNTLFLCGLSAVGCVMATYWGALDREFDVFMIEDAIMCHNSTYTDYVEEILQAVDINTVQVMRSTRRRGDCRIHQHLKKSHAGLATWLFCVGSSSKFIHI